MQVWKKRCSKKGALSEKNWALKINECFYVEICFKKISCFQKNETLSINRALSKKWKKDKFEHSEKKEQFWK